MSYIAFDLDALKQVPDAARAAGIGEAELGYGLVRLWSYCWTKKTDTVTTAHLLGFFGTAEPVRLGAALEAFGFTEVTAQGLRVKGVERYLRVAEGRSKGGKAAAAAGNLKRGQQAPSSSLPGAAPPAAPQLVPSLSPTSEHRTPNTEQRDDDGAPPPKPRAAYVPVAPVAPDTPPETWLGADFWAWAQTRRMAGGYVAEPGPPHDVGKWWNACLLTPGVTPGRLKRAFEAFGADRKHWEAKGYPFRAFMTQWTQFVPPEVSRAVAR